MRAIAMLKRGALVVAVWGLWTAAVVAAENGAKVFRAGAAMIDITPVDLPVIVNGGFSERRIEQITDRLHARCLVLDDGQTQVAFAVVDSCVLPTELIAQIKALAQSRTGLPPEQMLVSATHSHSTPSVCAVLGSSVDEKYVKYLPGRVAEGIAAAQKNLAPARIGWAVGQDPHNVFCRRFLMKPGTAATNRFSGTQNDQAQMNPGFQNPNAVARTGPADTDVAVIAVQTPAGRPLAVLGNYSTHYAGAPGISADYFAVFAGKIGELVGAGSDPAFVGIMTNGTSGDANCNDFVNPRRKYDYFSVGHDTAQAAYGAYQTIKFYQWVPLVVATRTLTLDVRMPSADEVAQAREFLRNLSGPPQKVPEVYARETIVLSELPPTRPVPLQAIRIGPMAIAAWPNEVYGSTGLEVKARSPLKPTVNIELANGYTGYLPPPEQHKLGGYTTWRARSSCLEVNAEPKIKGAILELLAEVATRRADEPALAAK